MSQIQGSTDRGTDQDYLRNQQYKDDSNLDARIQIHVRFSTNPQDWFHWMVAHFDLPPGSRILELGCGPGVMWQRNIAQIDPSWQVTLSDFSPGMVAAAQNNIGKPGAHFEYRVIDAQDIPFEAATFDVVIANHMLYHVPDLSKALGEIRRVLKSGGRLYASTVGRHHMAELHQLVIQVAGDDFPWKDGRPERLFLLETGGACLAAHFEQVERHRFDDSLHITEIEPLMDYYHSMPVLFGLSDEVAVKLRALVTAEMAANGAIDVTKASGLFTAVCPAE